MMQTVEWSSWTDKIAQPKLPIGNWVDGLLNAFKIKFAMLFEWAAAGNDALTMVLQNAANKPDPLIWIGILCLVVGLISRSILLGLLALASMVLFLNQGLWLPFIEGLLIWLVALVLGAFIGLHLGIFFAHWRWLRKIALLFGSLKASYSLFLFLLPATFLFTSGSLAQLFACIMVAILYWTLSMIRGIDQAPENLVQLGDHMGASRWQRFFKLELPHGLRQIKRYAVEAGLNTWWMVVVSGLLGSHGFGAIFYKGLLDHNYSTMIEASLGIALMGIVIFRLFNGAWILAQTIRGQGNEIPIR